MIVLKLTGVFEIRVHFRMIILQQEQMLLNYTFCFVFKYFQKREMYLEPSQTFKMKPFVKIADGLMALTIFIKSPILHVRLGCKNTTKSFRKATVSSTFLVLTTISLNIFSFYKFIFSQYLKMIFKFCCKDFYFYSNRYSHKYIRKYTNF